MSSTFTIFGSIPLYTFSLTLAIGIAFGLFWSTWQFTAIPKLVQERVQAAMMALAAGLIGGRIGFVSVNWVYFQDHWIEIPQIWLGGLSWAGALAGGLLSLPWAARRLGLPAALIADRLFPFTTSIIISTWLACWITGYAYGIPTQSWWGVPARDEWGWVAIRWPTQLVGVLAALSLHWGIEQFQARKRLRTPGMAASFELMGLTLTILVLSPFRADTIPRWHGTALDTWAALVFFVFSACFAVVSFIRKPRNHQPHLINHHHEN